MLPPSNHGNLTVTISSSPLLRPNCLPLANVIVKVFLSVQTIGTGSYGHDRCPFATTSLPHQCRTMTQVGKFPLCMAPASFVTTSTRDAPCGCANIPTLFEKHKYGTSCRKPPSPLGTTCLAQTYNANMRTKQQTRTIKCLRLIDTLSPPKMPINECGRRTRFVLAIRCGGQSVRAPCQLTCVLPRDFAGYFGFPAYFVWHGLQPSVFFLLSCDSFCLMSVHRGVP